MNYIQIDMDAKGISQARPVGTLGYDTIRGNAAYQWEYDAQWLHDYPRFGLAAICRTQADRNMGRDVCLVFCRMPCRTDGAGG